MNKNGFSRCAESYIGRLRKEGRHSTAHVYTNALFSFTKFCGTTHVAFRQVTRERLRRTQAIAALMFQFCGMSFADLAHLEKSSLERNIIRYNRIKTKTPMSVEVLDTAQDIISRLRNCQPSHPDCPDYLFSILLGDKKREDESAYREYQSALRRFNNRLKRLAKALRLTSPVTSYTIRHSWATTAKYRGVPIEMISESLGHKSIKTTQIYLKGFGLQERTEVNRMNLSYVKNCRIGRV